MVRGALVSRLFRRSALHLPPMASPLPPFNGLALVTDHRYLRRCIFFCDYLVVLFWFFNSFYYCFRCLRHVGYLDHSICHHHLRRHQLISRHHDASSASLQASLVHRHFINVARCWHVGRSVYQSWSTHTYVHARIFWHFFTHLPLSPWLPLLYVFILYNVWSVITFWLELAFRMCVVTTTFFLSSYYQPCSHRCSPRSFLAFSWNGRSARESVLSHTTVSIFDSVRTIFRCSHQHSSSWLLFIFIRFQWGCFWTSIWRLISLPRAVGVFFAFADVLCIWHLGFRLCRRWMALPSTPMASPFQLHGFGMCF